MSVIPASAEREEVAARREAPGGESGGKWCVAGKGGRSLYCT